MFNFFKKKNNTPKLPYTTEVHCHVLPGIDDGSPDVEHSLALIHQMKEWGLERIIATPHVTEASFENTPQTIGRHTPGFAKRPIGTNWELNSAYSAEYRMDDNFLGHTAKRRNHTHARQPYPYRKTLFYNRSGTSKVSSSICRSKDFPPF